MIPDNPELPVALGAYEVDLLDLTSAYQVFQNAGGRTQPYLVEAVSSTARWRHAVPAQPDPADVRSTTWPGPGPWCG